MIIKHKDVLWYLNGIPNQSHIIKYVIMTYLYGSAKGPSLT